MVPASYGSRQRASNAISFFIFMPSSTPSPMRWVVIGTAVLIVVGVLCIRFSPFPQILTGTGKNPSAQQVTGVPAFTSAGFQSGDALTSLGPEWTVIRQNDVQTPTAETLAGTFPKRETLAHLSGTSSTLLITEYTITDDAALAKRSASLRRRQRRSPIARDMSCRCRALRVDPHS